MNSIDQQPSQNNSLFIGVFLSGDLAEQLQAIRQRYSTGTDCSTPPHVTIVRTFWPSDLAPPESGMEIMARLQAVQSQIRPFELRLGGVETFCSPKRVLYLAVEATEGLLATRHKLLETLGLNDLRPFMPHLTLAKGLSQDQFEALLAQLKKTQWHRGRWSIQVDQLQLMRRTVDGSAWHCIQRIGLWG
jgi:2'-5' RNA ligase